jgi:hypothetical protein
MIQIQTLSSSFFRPFGCEAEGGGHGFLSKTLTETRSFLLSIQLAQDVPVLRKLSLHFQAYKKM